MTFAAIIRTSPSYASANIERFGEGSLVERDAAGSDVKFWVVDSTDPDAAEHGNVYVLKEGVWGLIGGGTVDLTAIQSQLDAQAAVDAAQEAVDVANKAVDDAQTLAINNKEDAGVAATLDAALQAQITAKDTLDAAQQTAIAANVSALAVNTAAIAKLQALDLTYDLITDDKEFSKEDIEKFGGRVLHRFDLTAKSIVVSYAEDIPEGTQIDHVVSVVANGHTLTTSIGDGSNFPMHDVVDDVDASDPVLVVDSVDEYSIEKQADKGRVIRDDGSGNVSPEDRIIKATTLTKLSAISGSELQASLLMDYRKGFFEFDGSDMSTQITYDPRQGKYIAVATDPTGSSGAWVRQSDSISVDHFKNLDDVDDYDCLKACANFIAAENMPVHFAMREYSIDRIKQVDNTKSRISQFGTNGIDDVIWPPKAVIHLNGATIKHGAANRAAGVVILPWSNDSSVTPFFFDQPDGALLIGPGVLDGGISGWTADTGVTASSSCHGIVGFGGESLVIKDVKSTGWGADGLICAAYVPTGAIAEGDRIASKQVMTINCDFSSNARSGVSNVGCELYLDFGSKFTRNGYDLGAYEWHSPAAGFNHEVLPFTDIDTASSILTNSKIIDNGGVSASSSSVYTDAESVEYNNCYMSYDWQNLTPLRATTELILLQSDGARVNGGVIKDLGIQASNPISAHVKNAKFIVTNPDLKLTDSLGFQADGECMLEFSHNEIYIACKSAIGTGLFDFNQNSRFTDNSIMLGKEAHDGTTNDVFGTIDCVSTGNTIKTDLYLIAADGQTLQDGELHAVTAQDTGNVFYNATGVDVELSGATEADLIADGLTQKTSGFLFWRYSALHNDDRRRDIFGPYVSDAATGHGWAYSNKPVSGVLTLNSSKQLAYGIDKSHIIVDALTSDIAITFKTANMPDDGFFEIYRTDTSANVLTVLGVAVPAGSKATVLNNSGTWVAIAS